MNESVVLSHDERELLTQLLLREHDEIPVEIHHCRVSSYRDDLRRRQEMVQALLERLQTPAEVVRT